MSQLASLLRKPAVPVPLAPVRAPVLQRKCACGGTPGPTGECEACRKKVESKTLQRAANRPSSLNSHTEEVPPIVHEVLRSPGQPIDLATRLLMEPHFGHDFGNVRVHTDLRASESARAVNALAYTVGPNIVFSAGRYAPFNEDGKRLIAHELTHVQQQKNNTQGPLVFSPAESLHERQANEVSKHVCSSLHNRQTVTDGKVDHSWPVTTKAPGLSCPNLQRQKESETDKEDFFDDEKKKEGKQKKESKPASMRTNVRWDVFSGGGLPTLFGGEKAKYTHNRNWRHFRPHSSGKKHKETIEKLPCTPSVSNITFHWKTFKAVPVNQLSMDAEMANIAANWQPCNTTIQIVINSPYPTPPPDWFVIVMNERAALIQDALIGSGIPKKAFLPPSLNYSQPGVQNARVLIK